MTSSVTTVRKKSNYTYKFMFVVLAFLFGAFTILNANADADAGATAAEDKGLNIAKAIKARDLGWGDSQSNLSMTLRNKKGQEVVREMRSKSLEVEGDGDKGLTIFDTPLDVKGTAFLSYSHVVGNDDQWLFLPALKRVNRIASRNKSGPFLGSEFAFEDLSSFEVEKNTYLYLRDEEFEGMDVSVVEMKPVDKYSGYTRVIAWIDKEHHRVHKIDYYDRRDTLLKTLSIKDYKLYKEKYWRADQQFMVNHKTGKSTDIAIKNLRFDTGLSDADFKENRLARAR
jgi:hypothetical protein